MTNAAEQLDYEEVPSGGIGDFVMSDDDFATLEKQNSRQEFGDNGIAEFEDIASRMASYGRFGDDRVVHVETGELIVPRKLIDQSPALKESIFQHLREAGIEDPERYVVGSAENSFNPETGLMEFGFFSKIFKGIKKAVKKIGKVLKKAAPVILGVMLTPIVGPIYAGALAGGIGTLIQGGNIKDAFKAALVGGATGAAFSAGSGALSSEAGVTALGNLQKDAALSNLTGGFSNISSALTAEGASLGDRYDIASGKLDPAVYESTRTVAEQVANAPEQVAEQVANAPEQVAGGPNPDLASTGAVNTPATVSAAEQQFYADNNLTNQQILDYQSSPSSEAFTGTIKSAGPAIVDPTRGSAKNFLGNLKEAGQDLLSGEFKGSLTNIKEAFLPNFQVNEAIRLSGGSDTWANLSDIEKQPFLRKAAQAGVSTTQKLMGYAPLALGAASAGGFFKTEPREDVGILDRNLQGNLITGADLIDADPEKYQIFPYGNYRRNYMPDYSQTLVASTNPGMAPVYGETGGQVFPRRNGGIMMDEGIPNEDSVRAMLMPGEFVMTTDAVRGAGNGNVDQGIKNMYEVMRGLERRGGAMS